MDHKKPFWVWVFCEQDGTPSFSRVATGIIVAFALGWVTRIVCKNNILPDFAGLSLFVTVLYGANAARSWAVTKAQQSSTPETPKQEN